MQWGHLCCLVSPVTSPSLAVGHQPVRASGSLASSITSEHSWVPRNPAAAPTWCWGWEILLLSHLRCYHSPISSLGGFCCLLSDSSYPSGDSATSLRLDLSMASLVDLIPRGDPFLMPPYSRQQNLFSVQLWNEMRNKGQKRKADSDHWLNYPSRSFSFIEVHTPCWQK